MIKTPPQHNIINPPGQIVNTSSYQTPSQTKTGPIQTLGDYVASVEASEQRLLKKKLTFDEWVTKEFRSPFMDYSLGDLEDCWDAAQENM